MGSFPLVGLQIKNIWNHHLVLLEPKTNPPKILSPTHQGSQRGLSNTPSSRYFPPAEIRWKKIPTEPPFSHSGCGTCCFFSNRQNGHAWEYLSKNTKKVHVWYIYLHFPWSQRIWTIVCNFLLMVQKSGQPVEMVNICKHPRSISTGDQLTFSSPANWWSPNPAFPSGWGWLLQML